MTIETVTGAVVNEALIRNYFGNLVGSFFKMLPLYEKNEPSLGKYMENLRDELLGCSGLIPAINNDGQFMSLPATLQYLIDRYEDEACTQAKFKQKVFNAISVCNKLSERYGGRQDECMG